MNEEWRPVVGHEGAYEVSDLGRVRSLDQRIEQKHYKGKTIVFVKPGRVLRLQYRRGGHLIAALCAKGRVVRRYVHQLVLESFVGLRGEGQVTLHLNHVADDNRLVNLRWGTQLENILMDNTPGGPRFKTHCKRGHELGGDNSMPWAAAKGWKNCKACKALGKQKRATA